MSFKQFISPKPIIVEKYNTGIGNFKSFLHEEGILKSDLKVLILTKNLVTETDSGNPSTTKRIIEECKKARIEYHLIVIKNCYIQKDEKDKMTLIKTNTDGTEEEKIEIIPSNTVAFTRKSASESEKGLYFLSKLENAGVFMINDRKSMEICNNKLSTTLVTSKAGILNPKTAIFSDSTKEQIEDQMKLFNGNTYPVILKTLVGEQGKGVMKIESFESLFSVLQTMWSNKINVIIQEFIEADYDIRVIVVNGEPIAAMKRIHSEDDFRSNVHQGAKTAKHKLTDEEIEISKKVSNVIGAFWLGLDIITDKKGNKYLLEVNTSAGTEGIEEETGMNIVSYIIKQILNKANWQKKYIEAGYVEKVILTSNGKEVFVGNAKLDTGNGITSSIHATDIEKLQNGNVMFTLNGKKMVKKIIKHVTVVKHQRKIEDSRIVVLFDVKIGDRIRKDIEFALTNRQGTLKDLEPVLLSRDVISRFDFMVVPDQKNLIGESN